MLSLFGSASEKGDTMLQIFCWKCPANQHAYSSGGYLPFFSSFTRVSTIMSSGCWKCLGTYLPFLFQFHTSINMSGKAAALRLRTILVAHECRTAWTARTGERRQDRAMRVARTIGKLEMS